MPECSNAEKSIIVKKILNSLVLISIVKTLSCKRLEFVCQRGYIRAIVAGGTKLINVQWLHQTSHYQQPSDKQTNKQTKIKQSKESQ